jgi:hypothetical protein
MSVRERYTVMSIDSFQCKSWILNKHYAKRMPVIEYSFGLFDIGVLVGIVTYGTQATSPIKKVFNPYKLIELNRLVVNDDLHKNALSYFVSSTLKLLPKPIVVVSYADTSVGHHGYIYQATNFIYTGLSAKRTDWKIAGMEHLHGTTIVDMSKGKENRSEYMKTKFGDAFYLKDRARKHRYFYFLGTNGDIKKMKKILPYKIEPYPKGDNDKYDASFRPPIQNQLFP